MLLSSGRADVKRREERGTLDARDAYALKIGSQRVDDIDEQGMGCRSLVVIGIRGARNVGGVDGTNADGQHELALLALRLVF